MKYLEVRIELPGDRIEEVIARLMNLGIEDVVIDDPAETVSMISSIGETEWFDTKEIWKEAEGVEEYLKTPASVSFYYRCKHVHQ